jgi:predicted nucleotidyltransferase
MRKTWEGRVPVEKINQFCYRWKVDELSLFGSIVRNDFRPDSDIDVLVSFTKDSEWSLFDLVDMKQDLESIFGREVDLVEKESLHNPFRRRAIMTEREIVYATD